MEAPPKLLFPGIRHTKLELVSALGLILVLTIGLTIYGLASFQDGGKAQGLESSKGWRKFTSGFFIGSFGGAIVAYLLLANIASFA